MPVPITCYRASRQFLWSGLVALAIAVFSGWVALRFEYAWIPAALALASAILLIFLALRPAIEIHEACLKVGRRSIPWVQIRRLDRIALAPLVLQLTLADQKRMLVIYGGDADKSNALLRHVRRFSREALIDGVPYRQFWGETTTAQDRRQPAPARYPLLLPDDEAEIERLFQRLKTLGHLEQKSSTPKASGPKREDE